VHDAGVISTEHSANLCVPVPVRYECKPDFVATLADEDCATSAERLLHGEVVPLEYSVCNLACFGWHFNRDQLVLIGFNEPLQKDGSRDLAAAFTRHDAWIRQRRERFWCWHF
jgi:hypothetical protein